MKVYVFTFFIVALFSVSMVVQTNIDGDLKALDRLQRANEFAVHDGSIALEEMNVSQGGFRFNKLQGEQNFIESINYSLKTTWDGDKFIPTEQSFFQEPIKIVYLDFVDSTHPSCSSFPCTYTIPILNETENLSGPSVIAILETTSPRFFVGEPSYLRKLSIYEYK